MNSIPNKLINETSPYLLQHAYNPVNWYPWGEEAFQMAAKLHKPVFLSIGYSTCHWCHVMERESFEDETIAQLLNNSFICIKVDKEERPDIDNIYMTACQMMTGSGGWPLNLVLTPGKKPFFATTYIPPVGNQFRNGMLELIPKLNSLWENDKDTIIHRAEYINKALSEQNTGLQESQIDNSIFHNAFQSLVNQYDEIFGGFGHAPKFPTAHNLSYLCHYYLFEKDPTAKEIVHHTLSSMNNGGIYDHIGFGFHRYSTDREWKVPHFEKMLYDQALIANAYIDFYLITRDITWLNTAKEVIDYVIRDLKSPENYFYSAEDADSEGEEGKFYLWEVQELKKTFNEEEVNFLINYYNIDPAGNYIDEITNRRTGKNILYLNNTIPIDKNILSTINSRLFNERNQRIRPHLDDKCLVDWNSLFITTLSKYTKISKNSDYLKHSINALDFIINNLTNQDYSIYHAYRNNRKLPHSFIDDYAFLVQSLIETYSLTMNIHYLSLAINFSKQTINDFWDNEKGGFFYIKENTNDLPVRNKEIYDGAIPSGNSIALKNFAFLYHLTGSTLYKNICDSLISSFSSQIKRSPLAHIHFIDSLMYYECFSTQIIITGDIYSYMNSEFYDYIQNCKDPFLLIINITKDNKHLFSEIAEYYSNYKIPDSGFNLYICKNKKCFDEINSINKLDFIFKLK